MISSYLANWKFLNKLGDYLSLLSDAIFQIDGDRIEHNVPRLTSEIPDLARKLNNSLDGTVHAYHGKQI